jgi:hypothetical protein
VPLTLIEPGGQVTFNLNVANNGPITVTLSGLIDDAWGDLDGQGTCAASQIIAIGNVYSCAYSGTVAGQGGEVITHTAVVTATSDNSLSAQDEAAAAVTINASPPPPGIKVYLPVILSPDLDEPNNSCQEAHPLLLNQPANFLPDDANDWYSFSLPNAANLQVTLTNFVPQAAQLLVYSGSCTTLQQIGHDGSQNEDRILNLGTQPAGQYHIWIINVGPINTTDYYTLTAISP